MSPPHQKIQPPEKSNGPTPPEDQNGPTTLDDPNVPTSPDGPNDQLEGPNGPTLPDNTPGLSSEYVSSGFDDPILMECLFDPSLLRLYRTGASTHLYRSKEDDDFEVSSAILSACIVHF